jgi:glucoamylase
VTASPVTVRGTSAPGNTVDVSATNTDANSASTVVTTTAAAGGSWAVQVPVQGGTIVLDVVATSPKGATAHVQRTVVFDVTPGQVLLDVTDPDGDDNGPGNYAYPTSTNFRPGAYDIQRSRSSTTAPA